MWSSKELLQPSLIISLLLTGWLAAFICRANGWKSSIKENWCNWSAYWFLHFYIYINRTGLIPMITAGNLDERLSWAKWGESLEVLLRPTGPSGHPYVCKAVDGEISGASATEEASTSRKAQICLQPDDGGAAVWWLKALNVKVTRGDF